MDIFSVKRKMAVGDPLWWSLDGVSKANCLAAFKFKARNNQTEAMKDLTGNGYTLDNSGCSWAQGSGFTIPATGYLDSSSLRNSAKSIVIKLTSASLGNGVPLSGNWGGINLWLKTPFCTKSFAYVYGGMGIGHSNGLSVLYQTDYAQGTLPMSYVKIGSTYTSGVIGFTSSGEKLYRNGESVSLEVAHHNSYGSDTQWTGFIAAGLPRLLGGRAPGSGRAIAGKMKQA